MTVKVDRRTLILKRLNELFTGITIQLTASQIVPGHFVHNRNELPKELVPGVILLDADEVRDPRGIVPGRELPAAPQLMRMTPEIYVVLDERQPHNLFVGEDLNLARAALLAKVLHDTQLIQILGSHGQMVYDGCVTDLARNRVMKGQLGMSITFVYPLIPGEMTMT